MNDKSSQNICLVVAITAVFLTFLLHMTGLKETMLGDLIAGAYLFALVVVIIIQQRFQRGILRVVLVIFALLLGLESLGAFVGALFPHLVH
jgi:hypothetical protein